MPGKTRLSSADQDADTTSVTLEVYFSREKETKNTVKYQERTEADDKPAIGTLYIQKTCPLSASESLRMTIEADDE